MKIYKHVTSGELAKLVSENTKTVTLELADGTTKDLAQIVFRRWWKFESEEAVSNIEDKPDESEPEITVTEDKPDKSENNTAMSMSDVIGKLENLFGILNRVYFGGLLPDPVITVQSTPKAYGHCTTKKIWKSETEAKYEINIGAEYLNRPSVDTAATMCHEMVHLYCLENDIADTCQKGRYHNKTFKAEAEKRDLTVDYDRTNGYAHTAPTPKFEQVLKDNNFLLEVLFARVLPEQKAKREREKAHTYVCPICGQKVRSTAELNLICGDCEVPMEKI